MCATRFFRISAANIGPNRFHQNRTASWLMSIPRSAKRSSTLRSDSGYLTYIITTRRMTSGELLKYRNGLLMAPRYHGESQRNWSDRAAPSASLAHALLQRRTHASERCANPTGRSGGRTHSADTNSWRIATSICSDLASDRDRGKIEKNSTIKMRNSPSLPPVAKQLKYMDGGIPGI